MKCMECDEEAKWYSVADAHWTCSDHLPYMTMIDGDGAPSLMPMIGYLLVEDETTEGGD